ncbi:uncharacterized protein [Anoplolepis gracilipes]|uniref:uncharacterized protein n=1 Tax=Anoplolepis gracilipes TaxID=354296 RepID=UPI003BA113BE
MRFFLTYAYRNKALLVRDLRAGKTRCSRIRMFVDRAKDYRCIHVHTSIYTYIFPNKSIRKMLQDIPELPSFFSIAVLKVELTRSPRESRVESVALDCIRHYHDNDDNDDDVDDDEADGGGGSNHNDDDNEDDDDKDKEASNDNDDRETSKVSLVCTLRSTYCSCETR